METNSRMATVIRNNAKWPVVITSIVMAVTLGSVGISEIVSGNKSNDTYLKNWKTKITAKDMQEIYSQESYLLNYGDQFKQYISQIAFNTALQIKDADRRGLTTSDEEVKNKILSDKNFAGENGKFDPQKYDNNLANMYKNAKNANDRRVIYEKKVRNEILKEKLKDTITKSITPTEQDIKNDFHNKFDTVEYDYLSVDVDLKTTPEPTQEEIQKYYDENKKDPEFQTEKMVKIKYVFFPYTAFKIDPIKDEELQAYYEQNKGKYIEKEPEGTPTSAPRETKYKPFDSVKKEIESNIKTEKLKQKALDETEAIHTSMSSVKTDKDLIDIKKAFETLKPANGTYGESDYFDQSSGAEELNKKLGDIKDLRIHVHGNLDKSSLKRINLDKGIVFYTTDKADVKEPTLKTLEECKSIIIPILKEEKSWEIAGDKAKALAKTAETDGWEKTTTALKLTPLNHKVVINQAVAKHKGIVTALLEKKTATGKILVEHSNESIGEKCYYVVFYKNRTPASEEQYNKQKNDIRVELDASLKSEAWSNYIQNIAKEAGLVDESEEKENKKK